MTPFLLDVICDPTNKSSLELVEAVYDSEGNITSGALVNSDGKSYPIINGIPRFLESVPTSTVEAFGDEWNYFNFTDFKINWLQHTVKNTFGSPEVFKNKIIVDAGGGSGAQTKWFAEYGAKHVIMMDLSHSVDDVVKRNLCDLDQIVDVIQCSIDSPPLRDRSIDGIVYCHNVIQHTPSVEKTAKALFKLVSPGGEFVFNCYRLNDQGFLRWIRWHLIYRPLRLILSRMPIIVIHAYARIMASLRLVPIFGELLEKLLLVAQGDVPIIEGESVLSRLKRRFKSAYLNTFDGYGAHKYQHHLTNEQIQKIVDDLQPDSSKVLNTKKYFSRPPPIGSAIRVFL